MNGYSQLEYDWKQSHKTLQGLTKAIAAMAPTSTQAFKVPGVTTQAVKQHAIMSCLPKMGLSPWSLGQRHSMHKHVHLLTHIYP